LIEIAEMIRTGLRSRSSRAAPTRSNSRLTVKSMPSNTGGLRVNSGTAIPGRNSARWSRISIVVGAT
jgi:hypothetical protein